MEWSYKALDALQKNKVFSLISWLNTSKNCINSEPKHHPFEEFYVLSNEFSFNKLNTKSFYVIEFNEDKTCLKICDYKSREKLQEFISRIQQYRVFNEFSKFYFSSDITRKKLLYKKLMVYLDNDPGIFLKCSNSELNDLQQIDINNFEIYEAHISQFLEERIIKKTFVMMIFFPSGYTSMYSNKNYFFEINANKYFKKNNRFKLTFPDWSNEVNQYISEEILRYEHSSKFSLFVSYFDPIYFFKLKNSDLFDQLVLKSIAGLDELDQKDFLDDIFCAINYFYFNSISIQQKYLFNKLMLSASKTRSKMSLLDILIHIFNLYGSTERDRTYFMDVVCIKSDIEYLLYMTRTYKIKDVEVLRRMVDNNYVKRDELQEIMDTLENLFEKKSLNDCKNEMMKGIKLCYQHYGLKFNSQINQYFSDYIVELLDIDVKTKLSDRKYLNKAYFKDLRLFRNEEGEKFIFKYLHLFDLLQPKKMVGSINEHIDD